jgi:hypothetical protein
LEYTSDNTPKDTRLTMISDSPSGAARMRNAGWLQEGTVRRRTSKNEAVRNLKDCQQGEGCLLREDIHDVLEGDSQWLAGALSLTLWFELPIHPPEFSSQAAD